MGNDYGQLGYGDISDRGDDSSEMGDFLPAVDLGTGRSAKSLAAGGHHTCAILDTNDFKCWGWNDYGQLGYGDKGARGDNSSEMGNVIPAVDVGTGRHVVLQTPN